MTDQPDFGLAVRVLDANGTTVGVGVLVGSREILTCAHVVNSALGRDRRAQDHPAGEITVEFTVGDGPPLRARVQRWLPPPRTGAAGDDIAGLVLTSTELPSGATPARLAANLPARGRVVDVFGYPGNPPVESRARAGRDQPPLTRPAPTPSHASPLLCVCRHNNAWTMAWPPQRRRPLHGGCTPTISTGAI